MSVVPSQLGNLFIYTLCDQYSQYVHECKAKHQIVGNLPEKKTGPPFFYNYQQSIPSSYRLGFRISSCLHARMLTG